MSAHNWGRWGDDDEIGAGNLVDSVATRHAAGLVRSGKVVSLARPLGPRTPVPAHRRPVARFMDRTAGDYVNRESRRGAFRYAEDTVLMSTHAGTHIDALAHAWADEELYNGHPAKMTQALVGAQRCGADKLAPIVTRGVLLDLVPPGEISLPAEAGIGATELERAYTEARLEPRSGDAVLLRTGWWDRHRENPDLYFASEPGLTVDAAGWLAARDPAVIGADNCAIELLPFPTSEAFPVHLLLLHRHGIPLIENLDLRPLANHGVTEFLLVAAPLPLVGSAGSPLNPLAVL
jgi:kynurenine formamidase